MLENPNNKIVENNSMDTLNFERIACASIPKNFVTKRKKIVVAR
jgi:hypothetical protein